MFRTLLLLAAAPVILAQELPAITEIRSVLREAAASALKIDDFQRGSAAANIAGAQVHAGDVEGALATLRALPDGPDRDIVAGIVANTLAGNGNLPLALHLLDDAKHPANDYSSISTLLACKGDFEQARAVARRIARDPGQTFQLALALANLSAEQWKAGDHAGAAATFQEALSAAEGDKDWSTDGAFRSLISALMRSGYRDAAWAAVEQIRAMAESASDGSARTLSWNDLAVAQAEAGDLSGAVGTAKRLAPGKRDAAQQAIAEALAKQGDESGALLVAAEIKTSPAICLQSVSSVFAEAGNYSAALAAIARIPQPGERAIPLAIVAMRQAEKHVPAALQTAALALESAHAADRNEILRFVSVVHGMLGDFAGARQIIDGLDAHGRFWPLWNLTEYMVEAGKKDEALALARSQDDPLPRAYALLGIGAELLEQLQDAAKKRAQR